MQRLEPTKNLIQIQEFVQTVNAGFARWSHRKGFAWQTCGGHFGRIYSGAHRKAERDLAKWNFSPVQIKQAIKDAKDMAELIRHAEFK